MGKLNFGRPESNDYDYILDQYSGTRINSIYTSSIPLIQFWKNKDTRLSFLSEKININLDNANLYFEYPTKSYGRNRSSMTDLMIIDKNVKIAIEAKYTEIVKSHYEKVCEWMKKDNGTGNREKVLKHWKDIVNKFSNINQSDINDIPIQFLHRTASACYENNGFAFVVYQLFYDSNTIIKLDSFIQDLKTAKEVINPDGNLKYYYITIEVTHVNNVNIEDVFQLMKTQDIYEFGKIECNEL